MAYEDTTMRRTDYETGTTGATGGADVGNMAGSTASGMQDKAQDVMDTAKQKTSEMADRAGGMLKNQMNQRTHQMGSRVNETGQSLRTVGQNLRDQGQDTPARLAEQAAGQVERIGSYLQHADADRMIDDLQGVARRNPWAFAVGGLVAGVLVARFLKSSAGGTQRRMHARGNGHYTDYGEYSSYSPGSTTT